MPGKIVILSEFNKELYYETDFYDKIIEEITSQLVSFIRYNPDDLSIDVLKKIVTKGFSNMPNKVIVPVHLKGEQAITIHLSF